PDKCLLLFRRRRWLHALQPQRRHRLRIHVDDADAVGVGVGDVELVAGEAEAARLIEGAALQPAARLAQERLARALAGVDQLNLTTIRVGDVELTIAIGAAEGVLQADFAADPVRIAELEQALPYHGLYLAAGDRRPR